MINTDHIVEISAIPSKEDDSWYQATSDKTFINANQDGTCIAVFAPKSMTESLFWIEEPTKTWRVIVSSCKARELREALESVGPVETMKLLGK